MNENRVENWCTLPDGQTTQGCKVTRKYAEHFYDKVLFLISYCFMVFQNRISANNVTQLFITIWIWWLTFGGCILFIDIYIALDCCTILIICCVLLVCCELLVLIETWGSDICLTCQPLYRGSPGICPDLSASRFLVLFLQAFNVLICDISDNSQNEN